MLVRTAFVGRFYQAPTISLCRKKMTEIMFTPANANFPYIKRILRGAYCMDLLT